ncbi:MAG: hypothetical protein PHU06_08030 [Gallionella sp.]|nr:hypothetical protein [Gallionella sp.]MDD4960186.1 hypothetical protein [Gallionella sp.]
MQHSPYSQMSWTEKKASAERSTGQKNYVHARMLAEVAQVSTPFTETNSLSDLVSVISPPAVTASW